MMRLLVIQHVAFEHLGLIAASLESHGFERDHLDLYLRPDAPCALDDYAAVIVMGGPMSANDDLPYIARELQLVREALSRGMPVLGVCLGAQILTRAAGAKVFRNPVKEIGWAPIHFTDEARRDPLFSGFDSSELVFHWHGETFDLPDGAQWLARSDACRHQAFRIGRSYGLQFHLEVTPAMIEDWLNQEVNCDDVAGLTKPVDPLFNAQRLAELSATVFGRWCVFVKSS